MGLAELQNVDSKLNRYLDREMTIGTGTRSVAATSQLRLREVLRGKETSDVNFPRILTVKDNDFLGGSFARHTKIWPLDDIDLFVPMDGGTLIYVDSGVRLPFTVASDQAFSRLTYPQWQTNGYVDSTKVLNGFASALKVTYSSSKVSVDKHCVQLGLTTAATSESDGIGFDVVLCLLLLPEDGSENLYLVPNGSSGWMRTNPRLDTETSLVLQSFHQQTYRKAVKLVKFWNKTQLNDSLQSYYIELALCKKFEELRVQKTVVANLTLALSFGFEALREAVSNGALASLVQGAPLVAAPILSTSHKAYLDTDATNSRNAFTEAYSNGQIDAALACLNAIFQTEFFA